MDIGSFKHLRDLVQEKLETVDKNQAVRSSGLAICSQICLALTIGYLAGGSLWVIHDNLGLSVWEFFPSLWRTIDAITSQFTLDFEIGNEATLLKTEVGFAKSLGIQFYAE